MKSLKNELQEKLLGIKEDVSADDKQELFKQKKINVRTTERYLCGQVANTTIGTTIYSFLKALLDKKREAIQ